MTYTSYKQFAPNGYEFIDDKTGQSVVASGPEAALHARKIDSIYAPVDPMMRQAAEEQAAESLLVANVPKDVIDNPSSSFYVGKGKSGDGMPSLGSFLSPEKPKTKESVPLPSLPAQGLVETKKYRRLNVADAVEDDKRIKAGLPSIEQQEKIPYKESTQKAQGKTQEGQPDDWNMEKSGSQFLSEPTTPEAIAEKAYIANEIAAAQTPTPPGPKEKLGPAVPVSGSAAVGPGPAAVADAMAAQEALAKANAAVEGRALGRQDYVDNELFNIAEITKKSTDAQIKTLEEERRNREKADSAIRQAMNELDVINNPNSAFNNPTAGDRIMGTIYIALTAVGAAAGGRDVAKAVADEMDRDGRARGKVDKKLESILKANGILNENVDKKKVIDASKGLLQTQAILAKIDALKSINMTQLQRDRLTLVEKEQLANQAMYTRDLEAQTNGTVNYAYAGGMKPKGGGGGSKTKALEEYRKEMGGRLSKRIRIGGRVIEMPVEMDKGDFSDIAREAHSTNIIQNRIKNLIKEAQEAGFSERIASTPAGDVMANRIMALKQLINKKIGGGEMSDSQSSLVKGSLFKQGPATIFKEMARDMEDDAATLQDRAFTSGGVEVE